MKIGYQGIEGSNSEEAALQMQECKGELIPLTNSYNVVKSLWEKQIDFGVMAISNSTIGKVEEPTVALEGIPLKIIKTFSMPIHHCLCAKQSISVEKIEKIISHPQALDQCMNNLKNIFSSFQVEYYADTALAAKDLSLNILDDNVAVVCRKNACTLYNLNLLKDNIEDSVDNITIFGLFSLE